MKYKNFLFDMGNVIMDFSPDYMLSQYTTDVKLINKLKYAIFFNPIWSKSDRGGVGEEGIYAEAVKELPSELHPMAQDIIYTWYKHKTKNKKMFDIMKHLKDGGYRLFLCSNAAESFHLYEGAIEAFSLLDAKIVSSDIGMVKPNPDFFQYVLSTYALKAEECFFVDDMAENVRGAYA